MNDRTCSTDGCEKKLHGRGLCAMHYVRLRKLGALPESWTTARSLKALVEPDDLTRFWANVDRGSEDECWPWTGTTDKVHAYARFSAGSKTVNAHRWIYTRLNGPLPKSVSIDHRCRNRICQNPGHLRPVSAKQNAENLARKSRGISGLRGVHFSKSRNAYRVRVVHNGFSHHGGDFRNLDDADRAATALRLRLYTHNEEDRAL